MGKHGCAADETLLPQRPCVHCPECGLEFNWVHNIIDEWPEVGVRFMVQEEYPYDCPRCAANQYREMLAPGETEKLLKEATAEVIALTKALEESRTYNGILQENNNKALLDYKTLKDSYDELNNASQIVRKHNEAQSVRIAQLEVQVKSDVADLLDTIDCYEKGHALEVEKYEKVGEYLLKHFTTIMYWCNEIYRNPTHKEKVVLPKIRNLRERIQYYLVPHLVKNGMLPEGTECKP